ncbi:potassium voltage-gated channel subfamily D member 3-like [Asterias rubens]|uniref:potassium voltage-gated channel subfamily D member 3-like n=1 Tax=Asterias rubens TaxID=7604 RepID=UPI0014559708|nr:potassium voltage-gated channel subfamily D member 3-like [Asterias rubens]
MPQVGFEPMAVCILEQIIISSESGCSIEDLSSKYSAYESQHHHLLSCLEKTTTWYNGLQEEPAVLRTDQSADFTNRQYQETEYTYNGIPFTRSLGSPTPPLTPSPSREFALNQGKNHAGSSCCTRWARGNRYEATPTSPEDSDLNDVHIHDPNSNPTIKKEDLSMDSYPKMNCTTTVTTAIVTVSPPTTAGDGDSLNTTVSTRSSPGVVRVSAL